MTTYEDDTKVETGTATLSVKVPRKLIADLERANREWEAAYARGEPTQHCRERAGCLLFRLGRWATDALNDL
jgi:hypothetical protein